MLERFITHYIIALLSLTSASSDGTPLDQDHDETDIAPEAMALIRKDCEGFFDTHFDSITCEGAPTYPPDNSDEIEIAAHDFWLTRNGHGAGFWDGDWPEPQASILTEAAHGYGESDPYIGDDGKIYI